VTTDAAREIIARLATARSLTERARLVGKLWRTVRALDQRTRRGLASRLGLDGVVTALESFGEGRGLPPEVLRDLTEAVSDPTRVRALARDLGDPAKRGALIEQGLAELLPAGAANEAAPAPAPPVAGPRAAPRAAAAAPTRATAIAPAVAPAVSVVVPPPIDRPLATAPPPAADERQTAAAPASPATSRVETATAQPAVERAREADSRLATPPSAARVPRPPAPMPAPAPVDRASSDEGDAPRGGGLVQRLLALRARVAAGPLGLDEARQHVESFPDGWPRRRACDAVLARGVDEEAAGQLVATLASESDRRWCLRRASRRTAGSHPA
jgi:hypothetical protein